MIIFWSWYQVSDFPLLLILSYVQALLLPKCVQFLILRRGHNGRRIDSDLILYILLSWLGSSRWLMLLVWVDQKIRVGMVAAIVWVNVLGDALAGQCVLLGSHRSHLSQRCVMLCAMLIHFLLNLFIFGGHLLAISSMKPISLSTINHLGWLTLRCPQLNTTLVNHLQFPTDIMLRCSSTSLFLNWIILNLKESATFILDDCLYRCHRMHIVVLVTQVVID